MENVHSFIFEILGPIFPFLDLSLGKTGIVKIWGHSGGIFPVLPPFQPPSQTVSSVERLKLRILSLL